MSGLFDAAPCPLAQMGSAIQSRSDFESLVQCGFSGSSVRPIVWVKIQAFIRNADPLRRTLHRVTGWRPTVALP